VPELVAVLGPPGPGWVEELRRWWDRGDAVLPIDHRLPPPAVTALIDGLRPTLLVRPNVEPDRLPGRPVEPGDALVLATSGTTASPKGVVLTHAAVAAAAWASSEALAVDPSRDAWLACLPLAHAGGLGVVTRALLTGTPLTVFPGFDAEAIEAVARTGDRSVLVSLVATALRRVDPDLFRVILLGGDAPPVWPKGRPASVVVTYGLTESGGGCVYDGVPFRHVAVRIVNGEVHVRGPVLARGYRAADDDLPLTGPDGWLATGDGGRWADDGTLVVDGRLDEVIVTGGEKVWPGAVEAVLRRVAGVADVAVVGRPDPEWGQRVVAVVVPGAEPPTLDTLRAEAGAVLPPWAAPKELVLVAELPRTALGKLRRGVV
jgi:O-succinylbenzoic acid--CoA ligase